MADLPHPYLPQTEEDIAWMLETAGVRDIDGLFEDIPEAVRQKRPYNLPEGIPEWELFSRMKALAGKNRPFTHIFAGAGCYDHVIPSTVRHLSGRAEFYTAYTPYQPEISQGVLQAIFEFQTMMCQLTGLDVSNASLYDGHTAAIEACAMALNSNRKNNRILISGTMHPHTIDVVSTYFRHLDAEIITLPGKEGRLDGGALRKELEKGAAGVLVQSPNIFGCLEDYSGYADMIHDAGGLFCISSNPMSLALFKTPGQWGADIGIGDTQPLGLGLNFGGPTAGYITATQKLLRKMPGRIVGETVDTSQRRAFVLTLQAREQHIKRQRATSNICSNQALAALASTVYTATMGKTGLKNTARICTANARYLSEELSKIEGVSLYSQGPFFNEFTLSLPVPASKAVEALAKEGILAGVPLNKLINGAGNNHLIIATTEKHRQDDLDRYIGGIRKAAV